MDFATLQAGGHEQVVFCNSPEAGLQAIIAIHSTVLGPALGGVRMRPYPSTESALDDALRLSRTMTCKNALAGLNLGGGKAVIIGDPRRDKSEALLRAFGRQVESLGGRYIAAEDVGTDVSDMEQIYQETGCVTGVHQIHGGSGDPAPFTAYGALQALKAALVHRHGHGHGRIDGLRIAVQGLGHIGMELTKLLAEHGARLFVADIDPERVQRAVTDHGAEAVPVAELADVEAEVFAPCALEGVLDLATAERLRAGIVCGTANDQLATPAVAVRLRERGILHVPGCVANAGGVMNISLEIDGYNRERAMRLIRGIGPTVERVLALAETEAITPLQAAERLARTRIETIGRLKLPMGRNQPRFIDRLRKHY